jgi:tetratricopeptide (TPR) repeat protein
LTIPALDEWTFIITRQLDVTSPAAYKQDQDVLRVKASAHDLPFALETFTILFADVTSNSCNLQVIWDKTVVSLPIRTDIDTRIMTQIDNALNKDNRPYYTAAVYYVDNGKDLNKALEWFDKAITQDPKAFYAVYQKARCQAKMGKKQEAIATAKKSIELSKQAENADYVALNEKLIASLQ